MSGIGGVGGGVHVPQQEIKLKAQVNKKEVVDIIQEVKTSGTITKEQFKKLAGNIEGGKDSVAAMLKDIVPADDIKKLKEFTFKRDGQSVKAIVSDPVKLASLTSKLDNILTKIPGAGEDTSYLMLNRLKGDLNPKRLEHSGDSVQKTGFASFTLSGSVGASNTAKEGSPSQWALGLTGTEIGISGNLHLNGSLTVSAENDGGKIKLSFEGKFGGGVTGGGGAQALGFSAIGGQATGDISIRKKVVFTFDTIDDAKKFLDNKGKGFVEEGVTVPPGSGPVTTYKRQTGGAEVIKEANFTLQSGLVPTTRTTKSAFFEKMSKLTGGLITGKTSFSNQSLTMKIESSKSEGTTKTYSLESKTGMVFVSQKKTATQLSLTTDSTGKLTGGMFNADLDLNKIRNNAGDKEALIKKMTDRFKTVANRSDSNVKVDTAKIESYIRGTIDKLLENSNNYFTQEGATTSPTGKGGILSKKNTATALDVNVSAPVAPGASVNVEVHAKWGSMVRIRIPLELDPVDPKKLNVKDTDSVVQLFSNVGGSVGGGGSIGQEGAAQAGLGGLVGIEVSRARRLTIASDTRIVTPPLLVVPTPTAPIVP